MPAHSAIKIIFTFTSLWLLTFRRCFEYIILHTLSRISWENCSLEHISLETFDFEGVENGTIGVGERENLHRIYDIFKEVTIGKCRMLQMLLEKFLTFILTMKLVYLDKK
jgi:hypothetical protein